MSVDLSVRSIDELGIRTADFKRWAFDSALPIWWKVGADHAGGGFFEAIGHDGRAIEGPRRARVQARQIYVYAIAADLGWPGPARDAVMHGLTFVLENYRRSDGLFRTLVSPGGAALDDDATLYDQAFMLLALAAAAKMFPDDTRLAPIALAALAALRKHRAHSGGGFLETLDPTPHRSNPHMHLLEAALAWSEVSGAPEWERLADEVSDLALTHFIDTPGGFLREMFDAEWQPLRGIPGRIVEPGHQFEWAWLLERWGRRRGRDDLRAAARRMFELGQAFGVDPASRIVIDELLDDLTPFGRSARLWPQTEWVKCALIQAETTSAPALRDAAMGSVIEGLDALARYLQTPVDGLWCDRRLPDGSFKSEPAPASSFYHLMGALAECVRLEAHRPSSPSIG